jgi:hypothetical protein
VAIRIRRSSTASVVPNPASLEVGELAVNTADAKLWTKHTNGTLVDLNPSGGGSGTTVYSTTIEVDFGTEEDAVATVSVPATWASGTRKITITPSGASTTDHDPEDYALEGIFGIPIDIVDGVGFTLMAGCKSSTFGKYIFNIIGV